MASLVSGYEYDIFISYRQKDNKHDGWVTEFVRNLKGELESTFKEEVSVYFDINPHDGLLETHDVDASLKGKLKCLIFIPVISRTYCDPRSFAWEHEFKAFVDLASGDKFGLKVKLPNGNVSNRVLPVRIHDLDPADTKLYEDILCGVLRGIEFVYEEPGVNRPLTPADDENKNLKKTSYRNQINKVALAVSEIFQGLETEPEWQKFEKRIGEEEFRQTKKIIEIDTITQRGASGRLIPPGLRWGAVVLAAFITIILVVWPKLFEKSPIEKLRSSGDRISVAVMPFQNMTNDTTWNVWQDGIQNELVSELSNSGELKVRQTESVNGLLKSKGLTNYASITPAVAGSLSQKLEAKVFIYGSIKQSGPIIRVNAQLIDSETEESFRSFEIDGTADKILYIIDSLSMELKNFLIISKLEKAESPEFQEFISTRSAEAYRYYILGKNAYYNLNSTTAINLLNQACTIDSNFNWAMWFLSIANQDFGLKVEARKLAVRLYRKKDTMPPMEKLWVCFQYAQFFQPNEAIEYLKQLQEIDNQIPLVYIGLGWTYIRLQQYTNAIHEYEKAFDIYNKWGLKPPWALYYQELGLAYHKAGQYKNERKLYMKAEQDFPYSPYIIYMEAILSLSERDTVAANHYIDRFIAVYRNSSWSEASIAKNLAFIFQEGGFEEKAEKFYRQALTFEPENPDWMNNLAYFLIDKDRNISEGLNLIDKALKYNPNNYDYLETKGWGLFKHKEYKKALNVLQKSWGVREQHSEYNHEAFLHLEAAKKALAGLK